MPVVRLLYISDMTSDHDEPPIVFGPASEEACEQELERLSMHQDPEDQVGFYVASF